jgi:hypothetical protein
MMAVVTSLLTVQPVIITTKDMEIDFTPRTPGQMDSFYEARGFPDEMRNILRKQCFITVGIRNTSNKKIWLDLSSWAFSSEGNVIKREHRSYWKTLWQEMNIPLNKQSTFRWTLIPESLDYLPGEREGGNILLPYTDKPVLLTATFDTGENRQGEKIIITTDQLFCAKDQP